MASAARIPTSDGGLRPPPQVRAAVLRGPRDSPWGWTSPRLFGIDLTAHNRVSPEPELLTAPAISVAAFAYLHPWKTALTIERYQLGFLIVALGCDMSNFLVITPMTIKIMMKRQKMEKDHGIGSEVGYSRNAEVAKTSPALAAMNRKFRAIHVLSSLASMMSFGSLAIHSWYLASKLDL